MARVADYSIIADGWVLERDKDTIDFEVPSNIDAGSRSILGFMLLHDSEDEMSLTLRMNGTEVWEYNFSSGRRLRSFLEVIGAGIVKPGKNVFSFQSSGGYTMVKLSDIVVWWQANI